MLKKTYSFFDLISLYKGTKYQERLWDCIFHLSNKVKNLDTYYKYRNNLIDIDLDQLNKYLSFEGPIERLSKKVYFRNLNFLVDEKVFIPRQETESIIDILLNLVDNNKKYSYIDICSGTGVIGICFYKKFKNNINQFCLLDKSLYACQNIKKNLQYHKISSEPVCDNWYDYLKDKKFEIITANFPYVSNDENQFFGKNIYDPLDALFADNKGWYHFEKILKFVETNKYWKIIILECSEFHILKWLELKKFSIFKFEIYKDFKNKFRFVSITNNQ